MIECELVFVDDGGVFEVVAVVVTPDIDPVWSVCGVDACEIACSDDVYGPVDVLEDAPAQVVAIVTDFCTFQKSP